MRLTPELVEGAYQWINPATRDRELDLRGYKIHVIENLGATLDQYDCLEMSDNEIRRLDGFPLLKRIKRLVLNNNRINLISDRLVEAIPNLEWLILTNNDLVELGDIDSLSKFPKLEALSLLNNPVATKTHYRLYVIHKCPHVRILDFRRVRQRERDEARKLFKGKKGKELEKELSSKASKTFVPGQPSSLQRNGGGDESNGMNGRPGGDSALNAEAIRAAISRATTLEEVERLNAMLAAGHIPGRDMPKGPAYGGQQSVVEEEDDQEMDHNV